MTRIAIILGSTRPGRKADQVGAWLLGIAGRRADAHFEIVDLREHPLPLFDEEMPPSLGNYQNEHTLAWARTIASYDGYVMITPEYNHSTSGVLKNALDYLFAEWHNKAVGFVSYGAVGGVRAVEHLRAIAGEVMMADVRAQVALSLITDFEHFTTFAPGPHHEAVAQAMLEQVIAWSNALAPLRASAAPEPDAQDDAVLDAQSELRTTTP